MSTRSGQDSNINRTLKYGSATVNSVSSESDFTASSESSQFMKASSPVEYSFIPADVSLLKNTGFCVLDQFVGIYGPLKKHLTEEHFIKLCYQSREAKFNQKKRKFQT